MAHVEYLLGPTGMYQRKASRLSRGSSFFPFGPNPISGVGPFFCLPVLSISDPLFIRPANVVCLECHGPLSPNGPHAASIEQHTHHKIASSGNECVACHMPKIANDCEC